MAAIDIVNRILREFKRYTGDGLPNEPVGAPLPVGDPASGVHNPKKAELREALLETLTEAEAQGGRAEAEANYAEEWAQSPNPVSVAAGGDGSTDRSSKYWAERAETYVVGAEYPVSYGGPQVLSDAEQQQARSNISLEPSEWGFINSEAGSSEPIYVLAEGQSNARGDNVGGLDTFLPGILVWNNENNIDTLANVGTAWVTPDLDEWPFYNGCNNMMIHACNNLRRVTGREVRLILICMGGKEIAEWVDGSSVKGAMYDRMEAVVAAAGISAFDLFLWHQGEADNAASGTYEAKWANFLTVMESDGYISNNTPVVIGEVAVQYTNINPVLNSIAAADPRVAIARISGYPTSDNIHFTGPAMVEIGARYAHALSDMSGHEFSGIMSPVDLSDTPLVTRAADGSLELLPASNLLDSRRRPAFKANRNGTNQALANATFEKAVMNNAVFDDGGLYDTTNSRWFPPEGRVRIDVLARLDQMTDGGLAALAIYKNGALFHRQLGTATVPTSGTGSISLNFSVMDEASGDDYYEMWVYAVGTSPRLLGAITDGFFEGQAL